MSDLSFPLNDGNRIPWIAFGTGTAFSKKDVTECISSAIRTGIVHLDGAQWYANEDTLGDGIAASGKPRSELFVTTKLHLLPEDLTVVESLKGSLQRLKVDYVDLFLIHDPTKHNDIKKVWKGMEECKKLGLTKSIGVSNFTVEHLEDILSVAEITPAVNQIEIHPYVLQVQQPIIDFCRAKGIALESYGGSTPVFRQTGGPLDPVLEKIRARLEKEYGKPVNAGQVLFRYYRQQNIVTVMTTRSEDRLKEFLEVAKIPDLTEAEIKEIDQAGMQRFQRVFVKHIFEKVDPAPAPTA
jgi:diketogulonate reductase-like aldo/keto reductase